MGRIFVIVHGHFYQPPRENPWTGRIEPQESAAPYRDWNQRITAECYTPNTRSRILDSCGRVLDVVNNFEHFSFNFGPTLMTYLEEHKPDTYRRILEADRTSVDRRGFGNAMAQAFNHMILPLASSRDRRTQIRWGITDFQTRFQRPPAGMWLPETAANLETLEDLAAAGMSYVILAPSQAEAIRPADSRQWQDVVEGDIPTDRPYVCHTEKGDISLLFFHEEVSRAVAFEHLLRNAGTFADRIQTAAGESESDQLILVCSDGESFGHHTPMGDMCFAYLATRELTARKLSLTNPSAFLADHPPAWEVRLKGGEGTAWSCAHGVGRWYRDCGCSTGGPASWNQAWREPLRSGFDALRTDIDPLFEKEGSRYLKDPWAARDDYIQVLLGKPLGRSKAFFDRHAAVPLSEEDRGRVYRLMEMQLNAMYMYTSCGWFFSDLAGIETVQNLKYALRAAQLADMLSEEPCHTNMDEHLGRASSNLPEQGSALDIARRFVRPSILSPEKVAAHHAMLAVVEPLEPTERLYCFRVAVHAQHAEERSGFHAYCCRLTVLADRTREGGTFEAAVILGSRLRIQAFVRPFSEDLQMVNPSDLLVSVEEEGFEQACSRWASVFPSSFLLSDMLQELRMKAVGVLLGPLLAELDETFEGIFAAHEGLLRTLAPLEIPLPKGLTGPIHYAGSHRFNRLVERSLEDTDLRRALQLSHLMESLDVPIDRQPASRLVAARLSDLLEKILARPGKAEIGVFLRLLVDARATRLALDEASLQDKLSEEVAAVIDGLLCPTREGGPATATARELIRLAGLLNLNTDAVASLLPRQIDAPAKDADQA